LEELLLRATESGKPQPKDSCPGEIKNHGKKNEKSLPTLLWGGTQFPDPTAPDIPQLKSSLLLSLLGK
jgi:hypothetical protein